MRVVVDLLLSLKIDVFPYRKINSIFFMFSKKIELNFLNIYYSQYEPVIKR